MRKLVIASWDLSLGPRYIIQFPPEESFPPKEVLLKLWAKYETDPNTNFTYYGDDSYANAYCALILKDDRTTNTYFIMLELESEIDHRYFQEILETVSSDLLSTLNQPQFSHVLSETYSLIMAQYSLEEEQLYYRIFEDKARMMILGIIRNGIISKFDLITKIEQKLGKNHINIDLLLSPFIRLGLIKVKKVAGAQECIIMISDFFCTRLPPHKKPINPRVMDLILQAFEKNPLILEEKLQVLAKYIQAPGVKELFSLLRADVENGMPFEVALTIVKNNGKILDVLGQEGFIYEDMDEHVYLVTDIKFEQFIPEYLPPILAKRFRNKEISLDQLITQLDMMQNNS